MRRPVRWPHPARQPAESDVPGPSALRTHPLLWLEGQQHPAHEQGCAGRDAGPPQGHGGAGMTTYICKCGRRVKKSTDTSTTGNRLSGYAPGHECWGCPYAMPYGNYQWDESARTVSRETQGYECRMSKTLTYASEFAGSIKDKCTCRVHSLDFDFLSQVSAWIKDTYPDREIFGSFSKDIRASDYGSDSNGHQIHSPMHEYLWKMSQKSERCFRKKESCLVSFLPRMAAART